MLNCCLSSSICRLNENEQKQRAISNDSGVFLQNIAVHYSVKASLELLILCSTILFGHLPGMALDMVEQPCRID